MATFMAIILVFGLIAFFVFGIMLGENSIEAASIVVLIPTFIIATGIYYDLNNSLLDYDSLFLLTFEYWLIASMVFLGVNTLFILLLALFRGTNFSGFNTSGGNFLGFLITLIGFISSLLGIASFYLDYLR